MSTIASQLVLTDQGGTLVASPLAVTSQRSLVSLALGLGARSVRGWSSSEELLAGETAPAPRRIVTECRQQIRAGLDPLGEAFCRLRSPVDRRENGATFTPSTIVEAMIDWAVSHGHPDRVVDPGTGSGRYLLDAARRLPEAQLLGIEIDPLAAILARANLAAAGFAPRAEICLQDFRDTTLPRIPGQSLYIGNPPYVRHHRLGPRGKRWLVEEAAKLGLQASQLAGLHVHFLLATASSAATGDYGCFITAAEWLDVNYGRLVRELFLGRLGGTQLVVIEPTAIPFADAATTAVVTYFQIGAKPASVGVKRIAALGELQEPRGFKSVARQQLQAESRWSRLSRAGRRSPSGYVELGELCRVHRGQVTGLNRVWIAGPQSGELPPTVLFAAVTKARELFQAGRLLADATSLRKVIDLPADLGRFSTAERRAIEAFLKSARQQGAHLGYVAKNRRAWWSVGLREPAPILTTYMARRPPAFVRNLIQARHINIAHGVYPREPWSEPILAALVEYLSKAVSVTEGRTYAGGLTKFEPREVERLLVPRPELLANRQEVP